MITRLKDWWTLQEKCPIDISRMIEQIESYEYMMVISSYKNPEEFGINTLQKDTVILKSGVENTFDIFVSLMSKKNNLNFKEDKMIWDMMGSDFGRYLKLIDERAVNIKTNLDYLNLIGFYTQILYGFIYESLLYASEEETKDIRKFTYALIWSLYKKLRLFGASTRDKKGTEQMGFSSTMASAHSYNDLLAPETQPKIQEEYDQYLKGLRAVKNG